MEKDIILELARELHLPLTDKEADLLANRLEDFIPYGKTLLKAEGEEE